MLTLRRTGERHLLAQGVRAEVWEGEDGGGARVRAFVAAVLRGEGGRSDGRRPA